MILLIGENNEVKELIEESRFSELGIWERTHMEEWIAKYPEILGEELLTITTEYDKFDKTNNRLDILAIDKNGKLVVIELKRDKADRFVDLQAIHYAAYCSTLNLEQVVDITAEYNGKSKNKAELQIKEFIENIDFFDFDNQPRIILVANDFNEETLAAVLWLRDSGVDITCVKLEAYQIGEKTVVTPDIIVPLPEAKDYMISVEQKKKQTSQVTQQQKAFQEFWSKLLKEFKEKRPEITNRGSSKESWISVSSGYESFVHFEWLIRQRPSKRFVVALHFESTKKNVNKKLIDFFVSKKNILEKALSDEDLIFDDNWGKKSMQIYVKRDSNDLSDENIKWGVKTMIKFYDAFKPVLDEYYLKKR